LSPLMRERRWPDIRTPVLMRQQSGRTGGRTACPGGRNSSPHNRLRRTEARLHRPTMHRMVPLLLLLGVVSGCGGAQARGADASALGEKFEGAVHTGDAEAACALLAPQTRSELEDSARLRCAAALKEEQLPEGGAVRSTAVYGQQAMVALQGDTLFLSLFPGGWRVVAAGCVPDAGSPYQCQVKGG
jgi:hypothetical protein